MCHCQLSQVASLRVDVFAPLGTNKICFFNGEIPVSDERFICDWLIKTINQSEMGISNISLLKKHTINLL